MNLTDLTVTRSIAATPEQVFDVWIDANSPGGPWFGSSKTILNAVVDGLFYVAVNHQGRTWAHYGRFIALDRPHRVEYTWVSESTKGVESIVALQFEAKNGKTEVTLRHSGVPDDEDGRKHKEGWTWVLSMLAQRFEPPTAAAQA